MSAAAPRAVNVSALLRERLGLVHDVMRGMHEGAAAAPSNKHAGTIPPLKRCQRRRARSSCRWVQAARRGTAGKPQAAARAQKPFTLLWHAKRMRMRDGVPVHSNRGVFRAATRARKQRFVCFDASYTHDVLRLDDAAALAALTDAATVEAASRCLADRRCAYLLPTLLRGDSPAAGACHLVATAAAELLCVVRSGAAADAVRAALGAACAVVRPAVLWFFTGPRCKSAALPRFLAEAKGLAGLLTAVSAGDGLCVVVATGRAGEAGAEAEAASNDVCLRLRLRLPQLWRNVTKRMLVVALEEWQGLILQGCLAAASARRSSGGEAREDGDGGASPAPADTAAASTAPPASAGFLAPECRIHDECNLYYLNVLRGLHASRRLWGQPGANLRLMLQGAGGGGGDGGGSFAGSLRRVRVEPVGAGVLRRGGYLSLVGEASAEKVCGVVVAAAFNQGLGKPAGVGFVLGGSAGVLGCGEGRETLQYFHSNSEETVEVVVTPM
eukprot:Rhum_TRINITY_DN12789_c1_g1::Rhum_TRINITY_DN12789_c1_g1_i1::g.54404::m.54404